MPKGRAFSRHIFREKHRKQYTFTKTKFVIGFITSVITSIFLGDYLTQYGPKIADELLTAIEHIRHGEAEPGPPVPGQNHNSQQ